MKRWVDRRDVKGRIKRFKPGGRKRVLDDKACRLAEKLLLSDKYGTLKETAAELKKQKGISVTEKTLSKRVSEYSKSKGKQVKHVSGKPKKQLTSHNRAKRLDFCKKNLKRNWGNVMFTDRTKFKFQYPGASARNCSWVKKGESWEAPKVDHPSVYNVYGGVTKFGTTKLKEVTGSTKFKSVYKNKSGGKARNITSAEYHDVVSSHFLPQGTKLFACGPGLSNWVLQQDNDPTHKAPSKEALEDWSKHHPGQNVTLLQGWPPHSPDLNPVENVWAYIQAKLNKSACKTLEEFKARANQLFESLDITMLRNLVKSMQSRMKECISNKGGKTKH